MKQLIYSVLLLAFASCAIQSATFVLSEPGDSNRLSDLYSRHELGIDENRMLFYNDEEIMYVPEGKQVFVRINSDREPIFILEDK